MLTLLLTVINGQSRGVTECNGDSTVRNLGARTHARSILAIEVTVAAAASVAGGVDVEITHEGKASWEPCQFPTEIEIQHASSNTNVLTPLASDVGL